MREEFEDDVAARLVSRHLHALLSEARSAGIALDQLTVELAAHAVCAALSFWSAEDLRQLIEAAETDILSETDLRTMAPAGLA